MNVFDQILSLNIFDKKKLQYLTEKINGDRIIDLLLYIPEYYDFSYKATSWDLISAEDEVIIPFKITHHISQIPSVRHKVFNRQPYSIMGQSIDNQDIKITFFQIYKNYIEKLKPGLKIQISGKLKQDSFCYQIIHPKILSYKEIDNFIILKKRRIIDIQKRDTSFIANKEFSRDNIEKEISSIEPIYPKVKQLSNADIVELIEKSLKVLKEDASFLNSINSSKYIKSLNLLQSINIIHNPQTKKNTEEISFYINNLSKLEFFNINLFHKKMKKMNQKEYTINPSYDIRNKILSNLPFELNKFQLEVIEKITENQKQKHKSLNVLQGDVGSGKTIVSLISMINAIESDKNCILLVPTVILAHQHFKTLNSFCKNIINIELLTGEMKAKEKKKIINDFAENKINILISTHTILYQKKEELTTNLGLLVIDEQHKFGVKQRFKIINQSENVDILMISATPIPRTLSMIKYGYANIIKLNSDPTRIKNTTTNIMSDKKIENILYRIKQYSKKNGQKTYWVTPAIKDNEESKLSNIQKAEKNILKIISKDQFCVLHGKLTDKIKSEILQDYATNPNKIILLSTSLIEVGIDIQNANIMVIEDADRFGLAQLHQLRGRVGRQGEKSFCILIYKSKNISEKAIERLNFLKTNTDGFKIAEYDLKTRGSGNLFGETQSGNLEFKINHKIINVEQNFIESQKAINDSEVLNPEAKEYNFLKEIFINNHTKDLLNI